MAVIPHPNATNPERYRVFDRALEIQEYFSIKQFGKLKALKLANKRQAEIDEIKKSRRLIKELPTKQIFEDDGSVKGLRRITRKRKGRKDCEYLSIQITVGPKDQRHSEISIGVRSFNEAYKLAQEKILSLRGLERTPEITLGFKKAKRFYW